MKNVKLLVTGAAGFIGSHLCEELVKTGYAVRALVRYNSMNSWGWLDGSPLKKEMEIVAGDIRDYDSVSKAANGVQGVVHLAAMISIPYSYRDQSAFVETNVRGTLNVLQAALEHQVKKVIHTSTSEVYGTAKFVPIDESHPRQPQSPYSATKVGADSLALSFHRSFGLPVVIARPFNTYGPRQSARAIVPAIITQALSGSNEVRIGAGHPTRDLVYVKDTVSAFLELIKSDRVIGEDVNIATQSEIAISDLAKKLIEMTNPEARIISEEERLRPENSEVERLLGSNKKIRDMTDWRVRYTLDEGLKETVEWFRKKENAALYKANIYNV